MLELASPDVARPFLLFIDSGLRHSVHGILGSEKRGGGEAARSDVGGGHRTMGFSSFEEDSS